MIGRPFFIAQTGQPVNLQKSGTRCVVLCKRRCRRYAWFPYRQPEAMRVRYPHSETPGITDPNSFAPVRPTPFGFGKRLNDLL